MTAPAVAICLADTSAPSAVQSPVPQRISVDAGGRELPSAETSRPGPVQEADSPAVKAVQTPVDELPWANLEGLTPDAVQDPGTKFLDVLASPAYSGVIAYDAPGGNRIALLPVQQVEGSPTRLPVIGEIRGWYQVLLPSRSNLPSQDGPVNGTAAWVKAAEVAVQESNIEVEIDLSDTEVNVLEGDKEIGNFDVVIDGGASTVRGRTFNVAQYSTAISEQCSTEPLLVLAAQLEDSDGYLGQSTAVTAVHGFSQACREGSGYTELTPGCTILADADMAAILSLVPVGSPVTIRD